MKHLFFFALIGLLTLSIPTSAQTLHQISIRLPGHVTTSTITVTEKNGLAYYQDDIILGDMDILLHQSQDRGLVMQDLDDRWPGGKMPYYIDEDFTSAYRDTILKAIDYINGSTNLLLYPRGSSDTYWIDFESSDECSSYIGLQEIFGQTIKLKDNTINGSGCYFPQIIHEIAHAAGIWHEHCRADRDQYININWNNIPGNQHHNFEKDIDENQEIGSYDFQSRMHYLNNAFAINSAVPTITRKNGSISDIGNLKEYSPGDVAAINWLYPTKNCVIFYNFTRSLPANIVRPLFYETALSVTANMQLGNLSTVTYDAGTEIILKPGFVAPNGSNFRAVLDGCGGSIHPLADDDPALGFSTAGTYEDFLTGLWSNQSIIQQEESASRPEEVAIAPNPFSGFTTVKYNLLSTKQVVISLMDATGKLVATPMPAQTQSEGEHQFNLEAGTLPAGMYFLVMQMGEKNETKRLILSK